MIRSDIISGANSNLAKWWKKPKRRTDRVKLTEEMINIEIKPRFEWRRPVVSEKTRLEVFNSSKHQKLMFSGFKCRCQQKLMFSVFAYTYFFLVCFFISFFVFVFAFCMFNSHTRKSKCYSLHCTVLNCAVCIYL